VILAMKDGREAAAAIDRALNPQVEVAAEEVTQ
jgi:hypothetical protein